VTDGDKLAETGADVEDKAETGADVEDEAEACEDDEGGVVVGFTVDGGAGTGIVAVDVVMDAPPGPAQNCPFWQQPNCPFVPRLQNEPTGQPPDKSGQQVDERGMQPEPQAFSPCAEHGIGITWRRRSWGGLSAPIAADAVRRKTRTCLYMAGDNLN
jgi:hypothetical protein